MAAQNIPFYSLNGGEISRLALARVDMQKMRMSADTMINWMPLTSGPMMLRPGTRFIGEIYEDKPCKLIEFIYSANDTALLELTDTAMRVWHDDVLASSDAVSSSIQPFSAWSLNPSPGATISIVNNALVFSRVPMSSTSYATGTINCAGNQGLTHRLVIQVPWGEEATFTIGTIDGYDDLFPKSKLFFGWHYINFIPNQDTVYIRVESTSESTFTISDMSIDTAGGTLVAETPWMEAMLPNVRYDQSSDVIYVGCTGLPPFRIVRNINNSWSIGPYRPGDGPFPAKAGDDAFKFTPNATKGDILISCSRGYFNASHEGSLIRLFHEGQVNSEVLARQSSYVQPIRVSGVSNWVPVTYVVINNFPIPVGGYFRDFDRQFTYTLTGLSGSGAVVELQRTTDPDGKSDWKEVRTFTSDTSDTFQDQDDNVIVFYRLFCKTFSGVAPTGTLTYKGGGDYGIARIGAVTKSNEAPASVLKPFSNTTASMDWRLQEWNATDGYPSSITLHEGRLWWSGGTRIWGSVSDDFTSFDFAKTGDAAPISRSIGKGPIQTTNFMMSLNRLIVGCDGGIVSCRSSSFDEPLTPTAFSIKYSNTQGAYTLRGLPLDNSGLYVQRSNRRVYLITFNSQKFDYQTIDLTRLNMDIGLPGFVDLTIQRQSDTRVNFVRSDGTLAVLLYDEQDEVMAWYRVVLGGDGFVENVASIPGCIEDSSYVVVKRSINGITKRYLEKFARLDQAQCGDMRLSDSHIVYSGANSATLTGLSHLVGCDVCVWGDNKDLGTYKVASGGSITVSESVTNAVVGLPYKAQFISAKLAYAAQLGTAVNRAKRPMQIGFVLDQTHYQGVKYGQYDVRSGQYTCDNLPLIEDGKETADNTIWPHYDSQTFEMNGAWNADSRIYLEANSPRPATVMGFTVELNTTG